MTLSRWMTTALASAAAIWAAAAPRAETVSREALAELVIPPFKLGEAVNEKGVHQILNAGGAPAGYVFQTEPLAPIPGFAGAPINALVTLDLEGGFLDVRLLDHNEPIFVSGLGPAPFHRFYEQYRGHAIASSIVVGVPYGAQDAASSLVYFDGVTKATASVRIAHESVMAAALAVAREKMHGVKTGPPVYPDPEYEESLGWSDLVEQGLAVNYRVTNSELQEAFDGSLWQDDDAEATASPNDLYLDLWIVDVGPKSIARAALAPETYHALQSFLEIADFDEPILLIEGGRHGLVSPEFVRNTAPDWLAASQDGLPVALRDADLIVELADGAPDGVAMILRTDRRLGFDPTRPWTLSLLAVREHGFFHPEVGTREFSVEAGTDPRFFTHATAAAPRPPWLDAIVNRQSDLIALAGGVLVVAVIMSLRLRSFASIRWLTPARLAALAVMTAFVGYWGQGQLSIVTPLATMRAAIDGGAVDFLLYDPFSLLLWLAVIVSFFLWGRGFFCGWFCPFGALQEFASWIGRTLSIPQIEPSPAWDARLKLVKYGLLFGLVGSAVLAPAWIDLAAEIEPFKTAITVSFQREWWFVAYAVFWLLLSMTLFKGFCRYVCPLGALMAIGGALRLRRWIPRRDACGAPCQLCRVKCAYGAIRRDGSVQYAECFQCLDCVAIHEDAKRCVPLVLATRGRALAPQRATADDGVAA